MEERCCTNVRITTRTDSEEFVTECDGRITRAGGAFRLKFAERGGNGLTRGDLLVDRDCARLCRTGAVCSEMTFDPLAETRASYGTAGFSADFTLKTSHYDVFFCDKIIVIDLEYSLYDKLGKLGDFTLKIELTDKPRA